LFSFRLDWHQDDRARPLVRQYQLTVDAILRKHPALASCAVHCCHCGIRFLTHPRNANRRDLRCEFGCREHYRRQQANQRSKKHYQTDRGCKNKKCLNGKRSTADGGPENGAATVAVVAGPAPPDESVSSSEPSSSREQAARPTQDPAPPSTEIAGEAAPRADVKLVLDGLVLDEVTLVNSAMLSYLAMIATVIEGRTIRITQLLQVLRQSMRQRSFDRLPRREYILRFLNQHPP